MNGKKRNDREDAVVRRIVEAAAAGPGSVPASPSPWFLGRVRAEAAARAGHEEAATVGLAAWKLLPAALALSMLLCAGAAYEHIRVQEARDAAVARLVGDTGFDAALLVMFVLGGEKSE